MITRYATVDDAPEIARVHVKSWEETYTGIIPDEVFRARTVEERTAVWKKSIAEAPALHPQRRYWLAGDEGKIVGFSFFGPRRTITLAPSAEISCPTTSGEHISLKPYDAEVYAIYLLKSHQGRGLGYRLLNESHQMLRNLGFQKSMLWVLEANPTRKFYERAGGRLLSATQDFKHENVTLPEVAYGWDLGNGINS